MTYSKKVFLLTVFFISFHLFSEMELDESQMALLDSLPPDQRSNILTKMEQASSLEGEIQDAFDAGATTMSRPEKKILSDKATRQVLSQEIVQSKEVIEQQLGGQVSSFCWPFGSPTSYSRPAYELIQKHYRLGFTTFGSPFYYKGNPYAIDRANVEASMRLPRVQFAVLGGAELYFRSRRRFFEKLIQN